MDPEETEKFRRRYEASGDDALIASELEALGSDYQANGYTTMAQADQLATALCVEPGQLLLDLGSGCGWPGLYIAKTRDCSVVCIDPVHEGVETAAQRAQSEAISGLAAALVGSGLNPPVRDGTFDAVVHADVLC
ncbi:MAG: SAM-dependent methyltransferase [Acidimicrobiales bacterium]